MKRSVTRTISVLLCVTLMLPMLAACGVTTTTYPWGNGDTPVIIDPSVQSSGGITIEADGEENGVISTLSSFKITTENDMSEEELISSLHFSPDVVFGVTKTGDRSFDMTPAKELAEDTLYKITVGDENAPTGSFVFQTESRLMIKSVFPADKSVDAPTNTGIEISFSEALDPNTDFAKYVTNDRGIKGSFQLYPNGKTLAFIPNGKLDEGEIYTFTVKAGIPSVSGRSLEEGRVFKFRTREKTESRETFVDLTDNYVTFSREEGKAGATLGYRLYTDRKVSKDNSVRINVYGFSSPEAAAEAIIALESEKERYVFSGDAPKFSVKELKKIISVDSECPDTDGTKYSEARYLSLPSMEGGIYLAEITFKGTVGKERYEETRQCFIQISDIVVYTEQSGNQMLVWVNEYGKVETHGTVDVTFFDRYDYWNAEKPEGTSSLTANVEKGISTFDLPEKNAAIMVIKSGDDSLVRTVALRNINANGHTMAYLFTDRNVYFGNDEISFSGVVRHLEDTESVEYFYSLGYSDILYPLAVDQDGSFKGSVILEDRSPSYHTPLRIYDESKELIAVQYLRITDEEKPVYKMSTEFDKLFYRNGDTLTFTAKVTFFDGTPAEGLKINLYSYGTVTVNKTFVTDANGEITYSCVLGNVKTSSTHPVHIVISAELIGEETAVLYRSAETTYFHSDLWFECEEFRQGSHYTEVRLNSIDTSSVLSQSDLRYPVFPDNIIGGGVEGAINVEYIKTSYIKHTESYYDPVTKTTKESVYYTAVDSVIKKETLSLVNGKATIPHIERAPNFDGYYSCKITYFDAATRNTYILHSNITDYGSRPYVDYTEMSGHRISLNKESYSVGDQVNITLTDNGNVPTGVTLFTLYSNGRKEYKISTDGTYSFIYKYTFIPGAKIAVTYFDGKTVNTLSVQNLNYDYINNNSADIEILTDKAEYRPGERVTLTVKMTKDGLPLNNGRVTICLVDEACFALGEQKVEPLSVYYSKAYNDSIARNLSFFPLNGYRLYALGDVPTAESSDAILNESDDANKDVSTESGETEIREDFRDNPIFDTIHVNEEGRATITFDLPDNITQWRITAVGFSESSDTVGGMDIGVGQSNVTATLPLFVNVSANDLYIEGDDIAFMAQCYGTATEETVEYVAVITNERGIVIKRATLEQSGNTRAHFNVGKLEKGSYHLTLTAKATDCSDGVKVPFAVVDSSVIMTTYKNLDVSEISDITPSLYPVNLTFYDKEYDELFDAASAVRAFYGTRADSKAAHYLLSSVLEDLFGKSGYMENNLNSIKTEFSSHHEFIPLMSYSEGDVELSAKIAAVVPEIFTEEAKERLLAYTEEYINSRGYGSPEEFTAALLLISGLGEGRLTDLYYARAHVKGYGLKPSLYLAAAFTYMGDWSTGKEILDEILVEHGEEKDGELHIKGKNTEESIEFTALALMTAAVVNKDCATKLASYMKTHTSYVELYSLETAAYFKTLIPKDKGENTLIYKINGHEYTVTVNKAGSVNLSLTKSEFESFEIVSASETLGVRASYKATPKEALGDGKISETVNITKTVTPYDLAKGLYKVTVSYTVTSDRNAEYFTLTDTIPSGARFFRSFGRNSFNGETYGSYAYLSNSGQTMTGGISTWNSSKNLIGGLSEKTYTGSVSYLIRGALKGEFICESAIAYDHGSGTYAITDRDSFSVK